MFERVRSDCVMMGLAARRLAVVATALLAAWPGNLAAQPVFSGRCGMQDLGALGSDNYSFAEGVSADGGVVVGEARDASFRIRAFRWTGSGGIQDLGTLGGGDSAGARGVSADGSVVVGWAKDAAYRQRAFRWTAAGGMQDLGSIGASGNLAAACDVSANGSVVVGEARNDEFQVRAFRWTAAGGMQDLGTLGGIDATAFGVSADGGVVVGSSSNAAGQYRAFRWTAADGMQDLGTLGGTWSEANDVSADGGVVVGSTFDAYGDRVPFRWTASGGMQSLGTFGWSGFPSAYGVSADGAVVVGQANDATGRNIAFRWTASGGMQHLGTLGGESSEARGVSADGRVVVGGASRSAGAGGGFRWTGIIRRIDTLDALNENLHRTEKYALNRPANNTEQRTILRRGRSPGLIAGTADIDVIVAECFDPDAHQVSFEAVHTFNGAPVTLPVPFSGTGGPPATTWGWCELRTPIGPPLAGQRIVKMRIYIPVNAAVGEYTLTAVVKTPTGMRLENQRIQRPVVVLFNPWDPSDPVFMPNAAERDEYVMTEVGRFMDLAAEHEYTYGQFDSSVLLGTLNLLDGLRERDRTDPVAVTRWLTDRMNSRNLPGLMVDCWDAFGCFGFMQAWPELSSIPAFELSLEQPWPIGQGRCYLFAGVGVSALRSLGVPARTVSARDVGIDRDSPPNGSIEIKVCMVSDGQGRLTPVRSYGPITQECPIDYPNYEDYWQWHVWGEAWFARPELGPVFAGWQAFDPSPILLRFGFYQSNTGPAPVRAVLDNESARFDVNYVRSQVDADIVTDTFGEDGELISTSIDTTTVGRRIKTKRIGSDTMEDITHTYKEPEFEYPPVCSLAASERISAGQDVVAMLILRNPLTIASTYRWGIQATATSERGDAIATLMPVQGDSVVVEPGEEVTRMIVIPAAVAQARILDSRWIRLAVTVVRDEEAETWPLSAAMVLSAVDVEVTLQPGNEVRLGQLVTAKVIVRNLLNGPLAGATLHVNSVGSLSDSRRSDSPIIMPTIAPGAMATYIVPFMSVAEGSGLISASVVGQATLYGSSSSAVDVRNCGTMQEIGAFPGPANSSQATGVSADGSVVVGWGNSSNGDRAFRWTAAGGMQDLGSLMLGTMSRAFGVSADGAVVVGESGNRAFRWTAAGGMQSLGTLPGAFDSTAASTSVDGSVVVGWVSTGDGVRAFRWTASGGMQSLGTLPGGERSYARAVSSDGSVVVGESDSSDGTRAFRWTAAGGMQSLGTLPGGVHSSAYGVSADGAVVVGIGQASDGSTAFRWTAAGGMQSLGTLPGGTFSQAQGVSADGSLVVGFGDSTNGLRAFLWIAGGGMQSLGTLPEGTRSIANGISADGSVVVGVGALVHFERAFRWACDTAASPCPADITNTDGDLPGVPDGLVDNGDFQAFFAAFFMPEADPLRLAADIANTDGETVLTGGGPDGAIDNGDFNAFFAAFFGGCP